MLALLPRHLRALGLDEGHIGVVMGAYPLAALLFMPAVARLSDRHGRRLPVLAGMVLLFLSCAAFELCTTFEQLTAARVAAGAGWAGVLVGSSIVVAEVAPPGRLGQALGVAGILTLLAMALGPTIGEVIVAGGSFDWLFRTSAALALLGVVFAAQLPVWPAGEPQRERAPGFGLVYDASLRAPLLATCLVAAGFGAIMSFLADLTSLRHLGTVAPFFDSYVPAAIVARLTCGSLSDRLGRRAVIIPSLALQALALGGLAFVSAGWQLIPVGAAYGFSHGVYYPALQALAVERTAVTRRARAIASFNFAFSAGMAASAFVNGFVAQLAGYRTVYLSCASAALVSIAALASDRAGTRIAADAR